MWRGRLKEGYRGRRLQQKKRVEEEGEGRVVMRDGEGAGEQEKEKRDREGRRYLLAAEPFIDKVVPV